MTVTVAIDCMGGDHGPEVTVQAALDFVRKHEDVRAILVGIEEKIRPIAYPQGFETIRAAKAAGRPATSPRPSAAVPTS